MRGDSGKEIARKSVAIVSLVVFVGALSMLFYNMVYLSYQNKEKMNDIQMITIIQLMIILRRAEIKNRQKKKKWIGQNSKILIRKLSVGYRLTIPESTILCCITRVTAVLLSIIFTEITEAILMIGAVCS